MLYVAETLPIYLEIPLSRGLVAIVDADDYEELSQFKWHAHAHGYTNYARRNVTRDDGSRSTEMMHQRIQPDAPAVDHINGNGLDNRRANLRTATQAENNRNRRIARNNTSGFIGVSWYRRYRKWVASVRVGGISKTLGYFDDPIDAAKARDLAALELHGEFAALNFPRD